MAAIPHTNLNGLTFDDATVFVIRTKNKYEVKGLAYKYHINNVAFFADVKSARAFIELNPVEKDAM